MKNCEELNDKIFSKMNNFIKQKVTIKFCLSCGFYGCERDEYLKVEKDEAPSDPEKLLEPCKRHCHEHFKTDGRGNEDIKNVKEDLKDCEHCVFYDINSQSIYCYQCAVDLV